MSGALMVIGLAHGATASDDQASRERTYALGKDLLQRFEEHHGATTCRELLGVHIGTPDGRASAIRDGLFKTRCPVYVRDAARMASELCG